MRLLACGLLVLASCQSPPPIEADCEWGHVHAPTEALAQEGCDQLRVASEAIPALVEPLQPCTVELWVHEPENLPLGAAHGRTRFAMWRRLPLVQIGSDELDGLLYHELVHAYLGSPAPRMPGSLEEGLANWVSRSLAPDPGDRRKMLAGVTRTFMHWVELSFRRSEERISTLRWGEGSHFGGDTRPTVAEALGHGRGNPYASDVESTIFYYELGTYLTGRIVERHGVEGWFELADLAARQGEPRLHPESYLRKAGFTDEEDLLRTAAEELKLELLAETLGHESFLGAIRDMREFRGLEPGPAELFEACEARLELNDEERPFAEWPGLVEWARAEWTSSLLPGDD